MKQWVAIRPLSVEPINLKNEAKRDSGRCANGYRQETRSIRKCVYRKQLGLETLVATRGPNFPSDALSCASCFHLVEIDG